MTKKEALEILKRIQCNPDIVDQLTEEEVKEIESTVNKNKA